MSDLKQGQRVSFKVGDLSGTGKVVGKAMSDQPIIGGTYIIKPDESIYSETYPFSHFVVPQAFLTIIEKSSKESIQLNTQEIQSNYSRVEHAESLILQLGENHGSRNTWLLNYGTSEKAVIMRRKKGLKFDELTKSCNTTE